MSEKLVEKLLNISFNLLETTINLLETTIKLLYSRDYSRDYYIQIIRVVLVVKYAFIF